MSVECRYDDSTAHSFLLCKFVFVPFYIITVIIKTDSTRRENEKIKRNKKKKRSNVNDEVYEKLKYKKKKQNKTSKIKERKRKIVQVYLQAH